MSITVTVDPDVCLDNPLLTRQKPSPRDNLSLMFKPKPCIDCGPHAVFHPAEHIGVYMGCVNRVCTKPCEAIWCMISNVIGPTRFEKIYPLFLRGMERIGFGTFSREPHPHECSRTRALREEAERRKIDFQEFRFLGKDSNHFFATWNGETIAFEAVPRPKQTRIMDWMDEKDLMREAFEKAGIPIAHGGVRFRWKAVVELFQRLEKPFIIKPHVGSRSRHTTIHIQTIEELREAFYKAKQLSPWVILEEELVGSLYRGTVIGGKTVGIARRDAPRVIANGKDTIRQLVEQENTLPIRHAGVFEPMPMDHDAEKEILRQGFTWESIPVEGKEVIMNPKFGRGQGSLNEDVTDQTHPDNVLLLEDAAGVINDPLIGIDFIMSDITRSWKEQKRAGIIECNSAPFLDIHHFPYKGQSRNTAGALWEIVFPGSGEPIAPSSSPSSHS